MFITPAFITPAYAQATDQAGGDMFGLLMPMILVFGIMYFLMIRPQQKRQKEHRAKLAAAKRGDKVVTGGGIKGTVRKVSDDGTLTVEISRDVQVEVVGSTLMDVVVKSDPQAAASQSQAPKGLLSGLFGGGGRSKAARPKTEPKTGSTTAQPADSEDSTGEAGAEPGKTSAKRRPAKRVTTKKTTAKKTTTKKTAAKKTSTTTPKESASE